MNIFVRFFVKFDSRSGTTDFDARIQKLPFSTLVPEKHTTEFHAPDVPVKRETPLVCAAKKANYVKT